MEPKDVKLTFAIDFKKDVEKYNREKNKKYTVTDSSYIDKFKKNILMKLYSPFIFKPETRTISTRQVSIPFNKIAYKVHAPYLTLTFDMVVNKIKDDVLKGPLIVELDKFKGDCQHGAITYTKCEEETHNALIENFKADHIIIDINTNTNYSPVFEGIHDNNIILHSYYDGILGLCIVIVKYDRKQKMVTIIVKNIADNNFSLSGQFEHINKFMVKIIQYMRNTVI
jgi:hypothetical protein